MKTETIQRKGMSIHSVEEEGALNENANEK